MFSEFANDLKMHHVAVNLAFCADEFEEVAALV